MDDTILSISDRGQITIPQKIRKKFMVKHFICISSGDGIILRPLKTREGFMEELEDAERDWKKQGGLTLKSIKTKYKL